MFLNTRKCTFTLSTHYFTKYSYIIIIIIIIIIHL